MNNEAVTSGSLREVWISSQHGTDASCAYNESFTMSMRGSVDSELLEKALLQVVARHDAMSAIFSSDGRLMRRNSQSVSAITHHYPSLNADAEIEEYTNTITKLELSTPFNLEDGPLWRAHIINCAGVICSLVFTAHHLVCDGWSIGILIREIGAIYSALKSGQVAGLDRPESFFNYLNDVAGTATPDSLREDLDFWKNKFSPPLPVLDLPTDNDRPLHRTYNARSKRKFLDSRLVERVRTAAAAEGCNPFSYLLAVYAILLSRLSGSKDIVVGVPVAGQSFSSNSLLVGHCVSMLPIRIAIDSQIGFPDFAAALQDELLDAYDHHQISFGDLLKELNVPRDPARLPLVPVGFTFAKLPGADELHFDGANYTCRMNARTSETFEVYATIVESKNEWELLWHFNSDLFDGNTAARWMESYEIILNAVLSDHQSKIATLPILTEQDRTLLHVLNDTSTVYASEKRVSDLFEAQASKNPNSIAVYYGEESITYEALNRKANQLANYLLQQNTTGKLVGICLPRTFNLVAGVLGILKAGAAYVPLDPDFPKDRLMYMVSDSGMDTIIVNRETESVLDTSGLTCIHFDEDREKISECSVTDPTVTGVLPSDLAYVIYTSGSTGKPKGIELEHRSVINFLTSMSRKPGMSSADKVLAITTISFDISVLEIFLPLTLGASIVLLSRAQSLDSNAMLSALDKFDVTVMQATPATWRMLTLSAWKGKSNLKALCGGEAITSELAGDLLNRVGELWNMYGPTETTVWSTCKRLQKDDPFIAIGPPIDNTSICILDDQLQQVPTGVAGELFIGGDGLARGYHKRPELTAERFIYDPSNSKRGRLYRTGDLARITTDGELVCLGRTDFQVKIRGYRIELGEIENVLLQHDDVKECAVLVQERTPGDQRLVAYVRKSATSDVDPTALKQFVGKDLPGYMIPSHFEWIDSFPLTGSGKIDRKRLPTPVFDVSRTPTAQPIIAQTMNPTERLILQIWQKLLGVSNIHKGANFFDLGGHSLLAIEAVELIRRQVKETFSVQEFFQYPTITSLVAFLDQSHTRNHEDEAAARSQKRNEALKKRRKR